MSANHRTFALARKQRYDAGSLSAITLVKRRERERRKEIQKRKEVSIYMDIGRLALFVFLPRRYVRKAIPFVSD